jgi:DNA-binding MarR family transcriptional regulator
MDEIEIMWSLVLILRRRLSERLRSFGITLPQLHMIQLARRKGAISPSAAAAGLSCDRPTACLVAQKCVAKGWLARRRVEADHRSWRLELTGEGEELLDQIERSKLTQIAALGDPFDILSDDERSAFRSALEKIGARATELFES